MNRTFFQAPMLGQVGPHMFSCMPFGEMYFFGGSAVQSGLMTHGLYPVVQNVGTTPVTPVGNGDIYLGGKTASKVHQAIPVVLPAHLRMLAMPEGSNDLPLALDFIVPDDPEIFFRTFLPNASDKQFQKDHLDKALNVGRLLGSETLVYLLGLGKKMEGYEQLKGLIDTRIMSDLYLLGKRLERIESTPYMELVRRHIGEHVAAGTADINVFLNIADNLPHLLADIKFVETFGYDAWNGNSRTLL